MQTSENWCFPTCWNGSNLISMSIDECEFSDLLKVADAFAFLRKTWQVMQGKLQTWRLLTTPSKVFERNHEKQISSFLEFFYNFFGFRVGYICQTTFLRMIKDWKSSIDNDNYAGSIAFDLNKAFDSLPYGFLMVSPHAHGVKWSACKV